MPERARAAGGLSLRLCSLPTLDYLPGLFWQHEFQGPLYTHQIYICINKVTAIQLSSRDSRHSTKCLWRLGAPAPRRAAELHRPHVPGLTPSNSAEQVPTPGASSYDQAGRGFRRRAEGVVSLQRGSRMRAHLVLGPGSAKTEWSWQSPKRGLGPEGGPEQVSGHPERWAATGRCAHRHSDSAALQRRGVHRRSERVPEQRGLARGDPLGR